LVISCSETGRRGKKTKKGKKNEKKRIFYIHRARKFMPTREDDRRVTELLERWQSLSQEREKKEKV